MYTLKNGNPFQIEWKNPLISKASPELSNDFEQVMGGELYKIKRMFYDSKEKDLAVIYAETFLSAVLPVMKNQNINNTALETYLEKVLQLRIKIADTDITIVMADQVLDMVMKCGLYTPLLRIKQRIKEKSGIICVQYSFINIKFCNINFPSTVSFVM